MNFQRAVDRLDHERLARLVLEEEMRTWHRALRAAETRRRRRHEHDILHRLPHLIDGGEIGERPDAELIPRERVARVLGCHVGVFGIAREIEQADRETLVVDAVEDHGQAERVRPDDGVSALIDETLAAVGQGAREFLAGGNDDHLRLHGEAELERAAADGGAVGRFEADAGAGEAGRGGRRESGDQRRGQDFADHGTLFLVEIGAGDFAADFRRGTVKAALSIEPRSRACLSERCRDQYDLLQC